MNRSFISTGRAMNSDELSVPIEGTEIPRRRERFGKCARRGRERDGCIQSGGRQREERERKKE